MKEFFKAANATIATPGFAAIMILVVSPCTVISLIAGDMAHGILYGIMLVMWSILYRIGMSKKNV